MITIYGNSLTESHLHTMGLAIDFDPRRNPYVYAETEFATMKAGEWWTVQFDILFAQAAQLYQAPTLSRANLVTWSKELSTEELHARVAAATKAIDQYFRDVETLSKDEMWKKFEAAGFTKEQFEDQTVDKKVEKGAYENAKVRMAQFKNGMNRHTSMINTQSVELVTALRDAGGLTWGGTELTEASDNGDFMHFDCRNEGIAQAITTWNASKKRSDTEGKATKDAENKRIADEKKAALEANKAASKTARKQGK